MGWRLRRIVVLKVMLMSAPKWITPFFYTAAISALLAIFLVFLLHDANHQALDGYTVADLTINLSGQPIREHCTTCHPNGSRPDPGNLNQTVKSHPDIAPHRIEQLGCTACHLGEGMALDLKISHGLPGLGARQVLIGKDLQASCFRCHPPGILPGAEQAWNGYRQFFAKACNTCHVISSENPGGLYGPDLTAIGSILGLDQLQESILEPRKDLVNSRMPRFPLSKTQARQISYFLKSQTGTPFYTTPMQVQSGLARTADVDLLPAEKSLSKGESLLYQEQCLGCHKYKQFDGRIGPDLTYIGRQRDTQYLKTFLNNPTRLIPGSAMPRISMEEETESHLLQFLLKDAPDSITAMNSKQLYMQLCQRCHAAGGDGRGPIQPNLANFPRTFTENADFFRAVSDQRLLESLRKGIPGTSMPSYGKLLDEDQMDRLLNLIFAAFIELGRYEKAELTTLPKRPEIPAAQQLTEEIYKDNCARCHGAFGTGTGPEYLEHLPRPRNLRNQPYFATLTDQRIIRAIHDGIPGTAMPAFRDHLGGLALWALVDQVRIFSGTQE